MTPPISAATPLWNEYGPRTDRFAIGLQAVDGRKTSPYLLETAKEHIEGRIDIDEAKRRVRSYYEEKAERYEFEEAEEADAVSIRISEILGEWAFTFSSVQLQTIPPPLRRNLATVE